MRVAAVLEDEPPTAMPHVLAIIPFDPMLLTLLVRKATAPLLMRCIFVIPFNRINKCFPLYFPNHFHLTSGTLLLRRVTTRRRGSEVVGSGQGIAEV
jgi:hypothetical protein